MEMAKLVILLIYLLVVVVILAFNWLYLARTIRANKYIGLYIPPYIKILVKISSACAMITAAVIGIVLFFGRY